MKSKLSRFITLFKVGSKSIIFENNNLIQFKDTEVEIETLVTFERNSWKDSPIILCKGLPYNEDELLEKRLLKNPNLK